MTKKRPLPPDRAAECDAAHELFLAKKKQLGLSQRSLAEVAGITPAAVNLYFKGVNALNVQFAAVLASELRSPIESFSPRLAREAEMISKAVNSTGNVITADFTKKALRDGELHITQYDLRAAMGGGQLPADYLEVLREVTIHRSFFEAAGVSYSSASKLALVTGWGQSMEGTINHGDPVFVDYGVTSFVSDGVYLFTWDNLAYIKRVQKISKTELKIISDNRNHDPFVVNAEDVTFHARAIMVWNGKKL
ncbi:S24 family peptidase [Pseudomonas sp.]|uniref:S24 family peptidase n=1 Tax=Pseudomonas sp. TaxID=306 RepID=UPI003CC5AF80